LIEASTDDVVVVGTRGNGLRALDLRTGAHEWTRSDALVRASDDRTVLTIGTSGTDRRFRAVDLDSGRVRWSRALPVSMPGNVSEVSFAVHGDTVVLTDACDLG
jgi:outer membrane protein assembly factor BamB